MASWILDNPESIRPLLEIIFMGEDPISNRATWVLDYVLQRRLSYLYPHLDLFTAKLGKVRMDSSVRPLAKACELLAKSYYSDEVGHAKDTITDTHLERIATASFDWLIGDYKVAAKVFAMTTLLLIGQQFKWIHPELKLILEQNYALGSAGYKSRAGKTLDALKKMEG